MNFFFWLFFRPHYVRISTIEQSEFGIWYQIWLFKFEIQSLLILFRKQYFELQFNYLEKKKRSTFFHDSTFMSDKINLKFKVFLIYRIYCNSYWCFNESNFTFQVFVIPLFGNEISNYSSTVNKLFQENECNRRRYFEYTAFYIGVSLPTILPASLRSTNLSIYFAHI